MRRMSLDARCSPRRMRPLLGIAILGTIVALAGCGSRDATSGSMRFITPSMSETHGNSLLFWDSKAYVWADDRY